MFIIEIVSVIIYNINENKNNNELILYKQLIKFYKIGSIKVLN